MKDKVHDLEELLEKSKSTDISVLLSAKEKAKRLVMDDPSAANLSAYKQASQMLEAAMENQKKLKDYKAVLEYAEQQNRKLGKSKLYLDADKGRLKKQVDGSFKIRDVDKYFQSLSVLSVSDVLIDKAGARQKDKEEAEIRRIRAVAAQAEFDLAKKKGDFIPKDKVHIELAGRAILLSSSIKTAFEVYVIDLLETAGGDPKKSKAFIARLEQIFDEALNEYSQIMNFEMDFELDDMESNHVEDGINESSSS